MKHKYQIVSDYSGGGNQGVIYTFTFDEVITPTMISNYHDCFSAIFSFDDIQAFTEKKKRLLGITGSGEKLIVQKVPKKGVFSPDYFRDYFANEVKKEFGEDSNKLIVFIPPYALVSSVFSDKTDYYRSFVEGFELGSYKFEKYKKDRKELPTHNVVLVSEDKTAVKHALQEGTAVCNGMYFARNLANEPGNVIYPASLAEEIKKQFAKTTVTIKVIDEKEAIKRKMGGLLAIGKGSVNPPRMIIIHYKPFKKAKRKICFVGKGVTFDSGGISIKPADGMWMMKGDMSGAAAVAGIMLTIAESKPNVEVIGIIPSAENMPSGSSVRPGDIVTASNGKSIEIDNTDAEGRVILADALHFASQYQPDAIIDLATLTGACAVALGMHAAGLFTKNDELAEQLTNSGTAVHERVWRLPLWDDYHKLNESDVADVKNTGGRYGGAISAAKFLENFVDETIPWVHLDIAHPAMPNKSSAYTNDYMTGFGVRLLYKFIKQL